MELRVSILSHIIAESRQHRVGSKAEVAIGRIKRELQETEDRIVYASRPFRTRECYCYADVERRRGVVD